METVLIVAVVVVLIALVFGDSIPRIIHRIMTGTDTKLLPKSGARKPSQSTEPGDNDPTKFGKYNKPRR